MHNYKLNREQGNAAWCYVTWASCVTFHSERAWPAGWSHRAASHTSSNSRRRGREKTGDWGVSHIALNRKEKSGHGGASRTTLNSGGGEKTGHWGARHIEEETRGGGEEDRRLSDITPITSRTSHHAVKPKLPLGLSTGVGRPGEGLPAGPGTLPHTTVHYYTTTHYTTNCYTLSHSTPLHTTTNRSKYPAHYHTLIPILPHTDSHITHYHTLQSVY